MIPLKESLINKSNIKKAKTLDLELKAFALIALTSIANTTIFHATNGVGIIDQDCYGRKVFCVDKKTFLKAKSKLMDKSIQIWSAYNMDIFDIHNTIIHNGYEENSKLFRLTIEQIKDIK